MRNGDDVTRTKGVVDILQEIILSPEVGLDLVGAAEKLIAEYSRFNEWVLDRKAASSAADLWNLASLAETSREALSAAWNNCQEGDGVAGDVRYGDLVVLIIGLRDEMRESRESNSVSHQDPDIPPELLEW
jgi:hypothetical protein